MKSILVYYLDFFLLMLEHYLVFCSLIEMLFRALLIATLLSSTRVKESYSSTVILPQKKQLHQHFKFMVDQKALKLQNLVILFLSSLSRNLSPLLQVCFNACKTHFLSYLNNCILDYLSNYLRCRSTDGSSRIDILVQELTKSSKSCNVKVTDFTNYDSTEQK